MDKSNAIVRYKNLTPLVNKTKAEVKKAVDDIKVGGTNLYTGTKDFNGDKWINLSIWTSESEKYKDFAVMSRGLNWGGCFQSIQVKAGETYVYSLYAKSDITGGKYRFYAEVSDDIKDKFPSGAEYASFSPASSQLYEFEDTDWHLIYAVFTATRSGYAAFRLQRTADTPVDYTLSICGIKLEKGNKPTDWSPAPEDMASKTELKTAIDDIKIGGRNLYLDTKEMSRDKWEYLSCEPTNEYYNGCRVVRTLSAFGHARQNHGNIPAGQTMTVSCYAKMENEGESGTLSVFIYDRTAGASFCAYTFNLTNEWKRYMYTFTPDENSLGYSEVRFETAWVQNNHVLYAAPKLERGNKATDWSPAPEDIENRIAALEARIAALEG